MIPTKELSQQKFDEFDELIFDGRLPRIPIYMSNAKGFLGKLVYRSKRTLFGGVKFSDFHMRISQRYDLSLQDFEDTIIHEMIHYYIAYKGIKDTSSHGNVFRKMMADINSRFNRHISISHRNVDGQLRDTRAGWHVCHVVAVVDMKDGRRGFKVLPKVAESIVYYKQKVEKSPEVDKVMLYWSRDALFSKYPVSKSLKVHLVDRKVLDKSLKEAEVISLKND